MGKGAKYTRSRIPCSLLKSWEVCDRSIASKLEAKIKSLSKIEKEKLSSLEFIDHLLGEKNE